MEEYEKLMLTFIGDEIQMVLPELKEEEKLHILITHDECLFYVNNDRPIVWAIHVVKTILTLTQLLKFQFLIASDSINCVNY